MGKIKTRSNFYKETSEGFEAGGSLFAAILSRVTMKKNMVIELRIFY